MLISFHVPVGHLYIFFGKMCIQGFCSFFNHDYNLLFELYEFFVYFGYLPLFRYVSCKYFLPFRRLLFYVDDFLGCAEAF